MGRRDGRDVSEKARRVRVVGGGTGGCGRGHSWGLVRAGKWEGRFKSSEDARKLAGCRKKCESKGFR